MRSLLFFLFFSLAATSTQAQKYSDIVIDAETGTVLHASDPDGQRFPASVTKIMTLYLIFKAISEKRITMETQFKVSHNATKVEPCKLGLKAGQKISVRHIILGLITKSANDASVVAAEGLCGSVAKFSALMNKTAKSLGMHRTTFHNPHGLPDPRQLSTARDMAILSRAMVRDFPTFYKLFQTRSFFYHGMYFPNHNTLLGKIKGLDGIKTGWFRAAGSNIAASAERIVNGKKRRIIVVVLGGQNRFVRNKRVTELMEVGFRSPLRTGKIAQAPTAHNVDFKRQKNLEAAEEVLETHDHDIANDAISDLIEKHAESQNTPTRTTPAPLGKEAEPKLVWVKGKATIKNGVTTKTFKPKSLKKKKREAV